MRSNPEEEEVGDMGKLDDAIESSGSTEEGLASRGDLQADKPSQPFEDQIAGKVPTDLEEEGSSGSSAERGLPTTPAVDTVSDTAEG